MPFWIKELKVTDWTLGAHPELKPYAETITKFYTSDVDLVFKSKEDAIEALKDHDKIVAMSFRVGRNPLDNTPTSISQRLADLANYSRLIQRNERKPYKGRYYSTLDKAEQQGAELFQTENDPEAFVNNRCIYYFQGAYMAGDQFAVGAALAHDLKSRLILLYQLGEEPAAKKLLKFYGASCKLTYDRLLLVRVEDSRSACKSCNEFVGHRINKETYHLAGTLRFLERMHPRAIFCPVGGATTSLAKSVLEQRDRGILAKWDNVDPNKNLYWAYRIDKFLRKKGVEKRQNYVIVWTRFSGKDGGAHPELDDSWTGLAQVCRGLLEKGLRVIVVGRPRSSKDIKVKMEHHLDKLDVEQGLVARHLLQIWGEYWKDDEGEASNDITGPHRAAEYGIFLRMISRAWDCRLVHLGMRSGAMDAAALLGMRTRFIEDKNNPQIERTTKWTGPDNTNLLYQRIPVTELPTWGARRDVYHQHDQKRGYSQADLDLILNSVTSAFG